MRCKFSLFLLCFFILLGCVEEVDVKTEVFEDILVVEAVLTNEVKKQKITLKRTYPFEEDKPPVERNAIVKIIDDLQKVYEFTEFENGIYFSNVDFGAETDRTYKLSIKTETEEYYTEYTGLPKSELQNNLYFEEYVNDNDRGVTFYSESYDPSGNSNYYRYEFEETYKIVAPQWSPYDLVAAPNEEDGVSIVPRTKEEKTCYKTNKFNDIILKNTSNLIEGRVEPFVVTSISKDNYIIGHRYSLLSKQYVLSREAYNYYKTLKDLSQSDESVFSENQAGFINNNIYTLNNPKGKVVGFFEVSKVYSKRVYFNYYDLYLGQVRPFLINCGYFAPVLNPPRGTESLWDLVNEGKVKFRIENDEPDLENGPYWVVPPACGDCTVLGTNIKPDFWED